MIVTLMSGGIDSTVLATYLIKKQREKIHSIFIDYGQRQYAREYAAYRKVCEYLDIEPHQITLAPLFNDVREYGENSRWSGMRNTTLISIAGCYALSMVSEGVAYAGHASDKEVYPDCTSQFASAYSEVLNIVTNGSRKLFAPFLDFKKVDVIRLGIELNAPLDLTYTCYLGEEKECHQCIACIEKYKALEELENGRSN